MKIVCVSDTHSHHGSMSNEIPSGDILIHSGDCTNLGKQKEVTEFIEWFKSLEGFKYKIFIAGNHDLSFELKPNWLRTLIKPENLNEHNVFYLEDESIEINDIEFSRPIKVYGSPWQPEFYNWAFNLPRNGDDLKSRWVEIPNDTDILITHGPPYGIRDFSQNISLGCELLRERVNELNPLMHVFGHIHQSHGSAYIGQTAFVNASICDELYNPINKPLIFDLTENNGMFDIYFVDNY